MSTEIFLSKRLSQNLKEATFGKWTPKKSKLDVPLLFHQDYISEFYRELFDIPYEERKQFQSAFKVVTEGKGGEISKINSVASSSLLSLLTFYRLFLNCDENLFVIIPGLEEYRFTKCYFEVQNKVIGNPSCVDVVFEDCKNHVLLFLESKLSEYIDAKVKETYGKSYISLYRNLEDANVFEGTSLKIDESDSGELLINSRPPQYIEGIKQSISHLIGIFQGPQNSKSESYLEEYEEYAKAFKEAKKIYYATILYNPGGESRLFENYKNLYSTIIGNHGDVIIKSIASNFKKYSRKDDVPIIVLKESLTYQDVFGTIAKKEIKDNNRRLLTHTIKTFYGFEDITPL